MIINLKKKNILALVCAAAVLICVLLFARASAENREAPDRVALPIVMYHQVMSNDRRAGRYIISVSQLEEDLKYLKKQGYTTVDTRDIIDYVYNGAALPEKCLMLTFDDGFESLYALVAPLLEKYDLCCVASVIGKVADMFSENEDHNLSYSYLTWDEIATLSEGDTVEIHNHSYDMHSNISGKRKGMGRLSSESDGEYLRAVREDIELCSQRLEQTTGCSPCAVVYPFGRYNSLLEGLVKDMGFKVSLVCEERINTLVRGEPDSLFRLGRYNRPAGISSERFFEGLLE